MAVSEYGRGGVRKLASIADGIGSLQPHAIDLIVFAIELEDSFIRRTDFGKIAAIDRNENLILDLSPGPSPGGERGASCVRRERLKDRVTVDSPNKHIR